MSQRLNSVDMYALAIILCFGIGTTLFTFVSQVQNGYFDLLSGIFLCGTVFMLTVNIPLIVLHHARENRWWKFGSRRYKI